MKLNIRKGTTSKILRVFLQDSSASTGVGVGGVDESELALSYIREGDATTTVVTEVAGTIGTFIEGGVVLVDGTNMLGVVEICMPDACFAKGAKSVIIYCLDKAANDIMSTVIEVQLVPREPFGQKETDHRYWSQAH